MSRERLLIIGGSYAAQQLAATSRNLGFSGEIVILGNEACPPYQRPPLSKAYLAGKMDDSRLPLVGDVFYHENDIELRLEQEVVEVIPSQRLVRLANGNAEAYDWLAFCTGASPRRLQIPGCDLPEVHYLRSLQDAQALKGALEHSKKVCVIGGGFIGLEVASVCRKLGIEVVLLESASCLLQRALPSAVAGFLMSCHQQAGVDIRLNCTAKEISRGTTSLRVITGSGEFVDCDRVIAGIGAVPNQLLAEASGIDCGRGILTNALGITSMPNILAAGDCAAFPNPFSQDPSRPVLLESIQATRDLAKAAASVVAGKPDPYKAVPWFWSDQYHLKLQIAGLYRGCEELVWRGSLEAEKFSVFGMISGRVNCAFSINSPADHMMARRLIEESINVDTFHLQDTGFKLKTLFEKT